MNEPTSTTNPILPGATIGMVAGGQLGRMTALAAAPLGYRVHVYTDRPDSPTAQVCARETVARFDDEAALEAFAREVDVVTFEWENVPLETLRILERHRTVRPAPSLLAIAGDRAREKQFVNDAGLATAPWVEVDSLESLARAVARVGTPCMVKSARSGYDGKGQVRLESDSDEAIERAWDDIGRVRAVVEGFIDFRAELSVVIARNAAGQVAVFDPVENHHEDQILVTSWAPARFEHEVLERAVDIARTIARAVALEGVLAVELFLTRDGSLLVNEIAPRPHNSGHWTIDACTTSQFEQFVRAVCNLPLGSPARHSDAVMTNLLGPFEARALEALHQPETKLHLYGKHELRPGRKTGHITRLLPLSPMRSSFLG